MTNLRNLKTFIFLMLVTLTIVSCSKKDDPTPVAINTLVTGVYPLTYYRADSAGMTLGEYQLPLVRNGKTFVTGTMTAAAVASSNTAITLTLHFITEGSYDDNFNYGQFELVKNGASYDLMENSTKRGTIDGKNLSIDKTYTDSSREIINARKYD